MSVSFLENMGNYIQDNPGAFPGLHAVLPWQKILGPFDPLTISGHHKLRNLPLSKFVEPGGTPLVRGSSAGTLLSPSSLNLGCLESVEGRHNERGILLYVIIFPSGLPLTDCQEADQPEHGYEDFPLV